MKRKVNVDLDELAMALNTGFPELHQYLDLETGDIIAIMDEFSSELEGIYEEIYDEEGNRAVSLEEYLKQQDDPDWQKEMILDADRVEQGYGARYIRIEWDDPYGDYRDMEHFVSIVEDARLRERLGEAIRGRGAFRRFKDLLARHPQIEAEWFDFKDARLQQRVSNWLETHDIEPV
jgi:hypothetical protein